LESQIESQEIEPCESYRTERGSNKRQRADRRVRRSLVIIQENALSTDLPSAPQ